MSGAVLRRDPDHPSAWRVVVDGTPQSFVDLDDPDHLGLSYLHGIAAIVSTLPDGPLDIVHIGGSAMSMLRHVDAHRPGSTHVVVEPDGDLVQTVLAELPLPEGTDASFEVRDGRSALADLPVDSADVVILDALVGDRVPGLLTTAEAMAQVRRVLRPDGALVVNLGDLPGHPFTRRLVTTLRPSFPDAIAVGKPQVVDASAYGNLVLAARSGAWEETTLEAAVGRQPFDLRVLGRETLAGYDGSVLRDAEPEDSPSLAEAIEAVRTQRSAR